jgi:hypothetical protein
MKYFRFIGDSSKDHLFENGKIYKGSFESLNWAKVKVLAGYNITDWEQVPKPKKTIHERIEKLKKQAEKEGMKCEVVLYGNSPLQRIFDDFKKSCEGVKWNLPTFTATNPKDEWDGVEFVESLINATNQYSVGRIYKVKELTECNLLTEFDDRLSTTNGHSKSNFKPSTEQAYIEQLKAKAKELFGEINEWDVFESDSGLYEFGGFADFQYVKKFDLLFYGNVPIYQAGQWAKRINDKITVYDADLDRGLKNNFSFRVHSTEKVTRSKNEIIEFLSSKLEEYLNS